MAKLLILNLRTVIPFQLSSNRDLPMLQVKVKTKGMFFTIPVPYVILNIAISILCSKLVQQMANKWTKEHFERKKIDFTIPRIEKEILKPIMNELKTYKGIVLVDVKAQDGTEVKVKL